MSRIVTAKGVGLMTAHGVNNTIVNAANEGLLEGGGVCGASEGSWISDSVAERHMAVMVDGLIDRIG